MDFDRFKILLEQQHAWPTDYTFKFIVPKGEIARVLELFPGVTPVMRPSSRSTFVGLTFQVSMPGSDEVIAIYQRAAAIEGLLAL